MNNDKKYTATLTVKAFGDYKFFASVKANSIEELKENARKAACIANERGRVYVSENNTGRQFVVNARISL
jgi:hypothetical protein